jgi:hypothetical protein
MTRAARHGAGRVVGTREQPKWGLWLFGACFISAIIVVMCIISPAVRQQWKLSLFRQNPPYTQLAFVHAASLPVSAVRGQGVQISFRITNDEGRPVSYRYVVASGSGAALESLGSAGKTVAPGAVWLVNTIVVPECARSACRMEVSLPQQRERIDFFFNLKQPAKSGSGK